MCGSQKRTGMLLNLLFYYQACGVNFFFNRCGMLVRILHLYNDIYGITNNTVMFMYTDSKIQICISCLVLNLQSGRCPCPPGTHSWYPW